MKKLSILFLLFFIMSVSATPVFGQSFKVTGINDYPPSLPIVVTTDKPYYDDGDKIYVTGSVRDPIHGAAVTIMIREPNGNIVRLEQVPLDNDNTFSTTISAGGTLWKNSGTYEITVQYQNKSGQAVFKFGGYQPLKTIIVDGTDYKISYRIIGGEVLRVSADTQQKALIFAIKAYEQGTLYVNLPRTIIDAKSGDIDSKFIVLTNTVVTDYDETSTSAERQLTIPFDASTNQITIMGTFVIPEFGSVAGLIFTIAILSVLLVFSKNGAKLTGLR